jgi:hypothetical protein
MAAPTRPSSISRAVWPLAVFNSSASSDSVPPSPSLSARSSSSTYLMVTMMVSAQIISEIEADDLETRQAVGGDRLQGFAKRVKRAGADIAVDDADGTQRKIEELARAHWLFL